MHRRPPGKGLSISRRVDHPEQGVALVLDFDLHEPAAGNIGAPPWFDPAGKQVLALRAGEAAHHFEGDVLIVQSNGGVISIHTAKRYPVRTALSGSAAGLVAARAIAAAAGLGNIIIFDMGGASPSACC
ncbi:MAG: hypothetical protein OXE86_10220 [Alphaproteobacteria bacterium]|nr:hypothetical protein [Alphaproteobacteria bacterium]